MAEFETKVCQFCGQVSIDECECDCDDAKRERVRREYLERANAEIENLLMPDGAARSTDNDTVELIKAIAENVSYRSLQSVRLVLVSGTVLTVKRAATGAIKIERAESKKSTITVSENVRAV